MLHILFSLLNTFLPDVLNNQLHVFFLLFFSLAVRLPLACHCSPVIVLAARLFWVLRRRFPIGSWLSYWPELPLGRAHKASHYRGRQIWRISEQSLQSSCVFLNRRCLHSRGWSATQSRGRRPDMALKFGAWGNVQTEEFDWYPRHW